MKKILVIDNDPVLLKLMTKLLSDQGHEVRTAAEGLSALEILKTYKPDAIFSDLIMPNFRGDKLCRIIRNMPELKEVYFVILSGVVAEMEMDYKTVGADAWVAKGPFNLMKEHVDKIMTRIDKGISDKENPQVFGLEQTFHREVTKELLSSKRHMDVILGNMTEGVVEITLDATITYANSKAIDIIGLAEEKLLASNFVAYFSGQDRVRIDDLLKSNHNEPKTIGENSPLNFNERQVVINLLPINEEGRKFYIVIINDVTERKRMEAQLLQAQKMEAIATLAGGIAHQFNNALAVINGNLELMKDDLEKNDELMVYVNPIISSSSRIAGLTKQLLAYARGGKYQPKVVDVNEFVNDTVDLIRHTIDDAIDITTGSIQGNIHIEADITQMQMALSAIISNAVESMDKKDSKIRIEVTRQHMDPAATDKGRQNPVGNYVCIAVADNGRGMNEKTRMRVFEPFFTTKFQGRGLGMAAVHGIVVNHFGQIGVESAKGQGTTVKLFLPEVNPEGKKE